MAYGALRRAGAVEPQAKFKTREPELQYGTARPVRAPERSGRRPGLGASVGEESPAPLASGSAAVAVTGKRRSLRVKRALDVALSLLLLAACAPLLLAIAALVKLTSSGPAVLVQERFGYLGRRFGMYKFRTMVDGAQQWEEGLARRRPGRTFFKIRADPRVTPVGRLLRKLSLDELPQLVNVLRGEMSLVGPRPLLVTEFVAFPAREEWIRFFMKPGMTGLWQVSGRNHCTDEERIRLDRKYVMEWSLMLDLAILIRTVPVVLTGRGAV